MADLLLLLCGERTDNGGNEDCSKSQDVLLQKDSYRNKRRAKGGTGMQQCLWTARQ